MVIRVFVGGAGNHWRLAIEYAGQHTPVLKPLMTAASLFGFRRLVKVRANPLRCIGCCLGGSGRLLKATEDLSRFSSGPVRHLNQTLDFYGGFSPPPPRAQAGPVSTRNPYLPDALISRHVASRGVDFVAREGF